MLLKSKPPDLEKNMNDTKLPVKASWTKWPGGNCPVPLYTKVQVRFASGACYKLIAGNLDWSAAPKQGSLITSYKVLA